MSRCTSVEIMAMIIGALPGAQAEIMRKTGLSRSAVGNYIRAAEDQKPQLCHVDRWQKTARNTWQPVYVIGQGVRAPRPLDVRKTNGEKLYQKSVKKYEPYHHRDPLVAALFGEAKIK